ncbi:MAG: hypothetical protein KDA61_12760, partial [Planctomycetales bacterium]|nr:hypothetical protein [Planctomycetales bacterium]
MTPNVSHSTMMMMTYAGWGFIVVTIAMVVIPFLRGKSDMVSAWSCMLVSCCFSLGAGFLEAVDRPDRIFTDFISFDFPSAYYKDAVIRNMFFFLCLVGFYYYFKPLKRFASRRMMYTPEWSSALMVYVVALGMLICSLAMAVQVPFFSELLRNLSHKAAVFAAAFTFYAWYRNRSSVLLLSIFLVTFAGAGMFAMVVSTGRRLLLTVCAVPLVAMYWMKWRDAKRLKVFALCVLVGGSVVTAGLGYQVVRRFSQKKGGGERTVANLVAEIGKISGTELLAQLDSWKTLVGQGSFDYGLITRRLVDEGTIAVRPLNS